jgi:hypothetical protein
MKKLIYVFVILPLLFLASACEKDKSPQVPAVKQPSSRMIIQKSGSVPAASSQSAFTINSAGLYQGVLYMSVSYKGGEKVHEFQVNWNGNIVTEGLNKVMELVVYHPDVNDPGILIVSDSVSANILDLGIPAELLNDPSLWIRVINSTNQENTFFFKAANEYTDPFTLVYNRDVRVVKEGCTDYGLWGDLWLVSNDSDPVSHYLVTETENTVSYIPAENDLLKIEFRQSYIADSSRVCEQFSTLKPLPVKITKIVRQ